MAAAGLSTGSFPIRHLDSVDLALLAVVSFASSDRSMPSHRKRMSQAAGNDGQAIPHGEPEHVSVHTEASSFTPQQVPEQAAPGAGPVPEVVPINQPQFAANFMNFLQQLAGAYRGDLAVALLLDSIYDLWKRVGADVPEPVQWAAFDRLFHEEYLPEHFVEAKREEFLKVTQGELTLSEYRQKFDELAGFGQDLVPTMEKRCKRFVEGLRPDLSAHLITAPRVDINALFKHALDMNAALIKKAEYEQAQTTHPRPPPSSSSSKGSPSVPSSSHTSKKTKSTHAPSPVPTQQSGKNPSQSGYRYSICTQCGRRHPGECWFTQGLCLGEVRLPCAYYSGPAQEPLGSNGFSSELGLKEMIFLVAFVSFYNCEVWNLQFGVGFLEFALDLGKDSVSCAFRLESALFCAGLLPLLRTQHPCRSNNNDECKGDFHPIHLCGIPRDDANHVNLHSRAHHIHDIFKLTTCVKGGDAAYANSANYVSICSRSGQCTGIARLSSSDGNDAIGTGLYAIYLPWHARAKVESHVSLRDKLVNLHTKDGQLCESYELGYDHGDLYIKFCKRPPSPYQEVYNIAWDYAKVENLNRSKRELEEGYAKTKSDKVKKEDQEREDCAQRDALEGASQGRIYRRGQEGPKCKHVNHPKEKVQAKKKGGEETISVTIRNGGIYTALLMSSSSSHATSVQRRSRWKASPEPIEVGAKD
ncbi:unnamed protein product [Cuscuta campestris]|uniref:Retrotransposon gag domain-containing protein n=1 Tax=Cuscuta campestris TaxID=132261 RepID=A0A484LYS6_9ASTE|nr:unnamed protein product [Cuscuta campestris]